MKSMEKYRTVPQGHVCLTISSATHLFLGAIRPLLRHDADPLVPEHPDGEDGDPAAVDELHGLDGQHGGDDVVGVVLPPRHLHEAVAAAADEHQAALE